MVSSSPFWRLTARSSRRSAMSHSFIPPNPSRTSASRPFGEKATNGVKPVSGVAKEWSSVPSARFQSLAAFVGIRSLAGSSLEMDRAVRQSGENARDVTVLLGCPERTLSNWPLVRPVRCPGNVFSSLPLSISQSLMVWSELAERARRPSGEIATDSTSLEWPA